MSRNLPFPKVVSVEQMQEAERSADASGLSYDEMMENAGRAVAEAVLDRAGGVGGKRILVLVGSGNNGGDSLVAAHHLLEAGARVAIYLTKARPASDKNWDRVRERADEIALASEDPERERLAGMLAGVDIVLDGVLGTGFRLPLKGTAKRVLGAVKRGLDEAERRPYIVSIDCPSGVDCDSGEAADECIPADLTVTLAAVKQGLIRFPGAAFVGELVAGDIGFAEDLRPLAELDAEYVTREGVAGWLPERPRNAHKGTFGRVVIAAGCVNFPGAAALAGLGAYRSGAGLVTLAVVPAVQPALIPLLPEATWILLPEELGVIAEAAADVLRANIERTQALLIGPGFGMEAETRAFLERLLERGATQARIGFIRDQTPDDGPELPPCVIDADGLKHLAAIEGWPERLPGVAILTPHPGEMAVLTGRRVQEIQADRLAAAKEWARRWGHVVVLKGAFTVVADPGGRAFVLPFATPALARAGTGDVLAGVIAGLRAQGLAPLRAAVLGGYLHGRAGELAAESLGATASVIAGDVAEHLPEAIASLSGR